MVAAVAALLLSTAAIQEAKPVSLLNGRDLTGWHVDSPDLEKNPALVNPFSIKDGSLVASGVPTGTIITDAAYENYRLTVEYRYIEKAGNSGILLHCSTPRGAFGVFPKSLEVQLKSGDGGDFVNLGEDIEVPDMEKRRGARTNRRIANLTDGSEKPIGEFNTIMVEAKGDKVKVWMNGSLVNEGFNATAQKGQIGLQSEGVPIEFRKVELQKLKP